MTSPAAAAILNGMPHPADLRADSRDGQTFVTAGQVIIACYPDGDVTMRNVAVAVARQLGFSGQQVAQVFSLTESGREVAAVDFPAAADAVQGMLPCSAGERQVLLIAASIAEGIPVDLRGWPAGRTSSPSPPRSRTAPPSGT